MVQKKVSWAWIKEHRAKEEGEREWEFMGGGSTSEKFAGM